MKPATTPKDRKPQSYIEALLFALTSIDPGINPTKKLLLKKTAAAGFEPIGNQFNAAMYNFKRLGLCHSVDKGVYQIDPKIVAFEKDYLAGKIGMWYQKGAVKPSMLRAPKKGTRHKSINIVRAIFAVYGTAKPLTFRNVQAIAEKHNYKITIATLGGYYRKKNEIQKTDLKLGHAATYQTVSAFFTKNAPLLDILIDILPDQKNQILAHFNQREPALVSQHHEPADTESPNKPTEASEPVQIDDDRESLDTIDAANVGASILAYVLSLKKQLAAQQESGPMESPESQQKISRMASTIEGLKNERNQLNLKISKLESILSVREKHIERLEIDLEKIQSKINDKLVPRSRFKVSEVARITKLIKSP